MSDEYTTGVPTKASSTEVVGRINSTALPSPHMIGVPNTPEEHHELLIRARIREQVVKPYKAEIDRLHEALTILSNIALANLELSKEKLEDK